MPCSTPDPDQPTLRDLLFDAFVASTDPAIDALTAYGRYRAAFVELMTAGKDPGVYKLAFATLTGAADEAG